MTAFWPVFAVIVPFAGPMTALGQQKKHRSESCDGMTVESMVAGVSMPRNDLLFNNAIHLLPYTGAGSGLRRAMDTGVEVQFDDNEKTREFVITIPRREHHVKNAPSNGEMHHENAPSSAKAHQEGGETHQENAPSSEKTHQLTKKQTDIINFCSIPRSSKEIMDRLGLYNQSRNRQRHIQPLIDMGYLEPTIQGKKYNVNCRCI